MLIIAKVWHCTQFAWLELLGIHCSTYSPTTCWCVRLLHSSHLIMMTSSNGNIFHVTGPLCGEFTGPGEIPTQRPVTRSFDVSFDLRLNKRLSKQPRGWWFETPQWSLWRQCNVMVTNNQKNYIFLFIEVSFTQTALSGIIIWICFTLIYLRNLIQTSDANIVYLQLCCFILICL